MVEVLDTTPWETLEQTVRGTRLLNQPDVLPYKNAQISLERVCFAGTDTTDPALANHLRVRSTSRYVAENLLRTQREIAKDIAPGYDPLELDCGLVLGGFDKDGNAVQTGLVPPIVEVTDEEGGYVLDGSHRANIGRALGRTSFMAIVIRNIDPGYPAYAHPNDWNEVTTYEVPPSDPALRKNYRADVNIYNLYRNFGPLNGSEPRYT